MPEPKRQMPPWLVGLIIAVVLVGLALLVFAALGFGDNPVLGSQGSATASSGPGETDGIAITYLDGEVGSFEDFRGAPVVLNFWASWCPACVAEMPDFEKVHELFAGKVQFVGANTQEVSLSDARSLVGQTGVTYPLIDDPNGELYAFFGGISMPTTVFIDGNGDVVDVHSGTIFASDLEAKIREVFQL